MFFMIVVPLLTVHMSPMVWDGIILIHTHGVLRMLMIQYYVLVAIQVQLIRNTASAGLRVQILVDIDAVPH